MLITLSINTFSQRSYGGYPPSFSNLLSENKKTIPIPEVIKSNMNSISLKTQFENDSFFEIFSSPVDVDISLTNSGRWDTLTNRDKIWRIKITSQTAYSIQLFFDDFFLSEDAELYVYNEDKSMVLGAFTNLNNVISNKFTIQPVQGESIILELLEPVNNDQLSHFHIFKIGHAFQDIFNKTLSGCNFDVTCPETQGWANQIRSSVKLLFTTPAFTSIRGSGTIVNNQKLDGTPYLLTAFHNIDNELINNVRDCQISFAELDMLNDYAIFVFNYQAIVCGGLPNTMSQTISGANYVVGSNDGDFALLKLSSMDANYSTYMSGWDNSGQTPSTSACIHYPGFSEYKKFSLISVPLSVVNISGATPCTTGVSNYWLAPFNNITNPYNGIEFGSSGGGLYSNLKHIIGIVSATTGTSCNDNGHLATFGRISEFWNILSPYLAPLNTNDFTCEGIDYNSTPAHCNNTICDGDEDCMTDASKPINCGGSICPPCSTILDPPPNPPNCTFCKFDKVFEGKEWHNKTKNYLTSVSITARMDNNFNFTMVTDNSDIKFRAHDFIELNEGFGVDEGSTFEASLTSFNCECTFFNCGHFGCNNRFMNDTATNNNYEEEMKKETLNSNGGNFITPNPSTGIFTLQLKENTVGEISIYNPLGQVIYQSNSLPSGTSPLRGDRGGLGWAIDLSSQPKGIYFLKVQTADKVYTEKVIVQ